MLNIKSWLPIFSGFYGTIWDNSENNSELEYLREQGLTDEELEELSSLKCYDEGIRDYQDGITRELTNFIGQDLIKLGMLKSIKYERIVSPKYYSNDSVNVTDTLTKKNQKAIKDYLANHFDAWRKYLQEYYTSCSGFISHYDNDPLLDDWRDDAIFAEHQLGQVYNFILNNEYTGDDIEYYYYDFVAGNVYESYGTVDDIREELKERSFYDDKPELVLKLIKQG